jgi:type II secretory pathway pseudopilin PulG
MGGSFGARRQLAMLVGHLSTERWRAHCQGWPVGYQGIMTGSAASGEPGRTPRVWRGGFSLIEALVVLAVAGAALMLIFSVGLRSTEIAFRLGRRALDVADRQLATDALRTVVRGLDVAPSGAVPRLGGSTLAGDSRGFAGSAVLAAATPCAGSGLLARVTIALVGDASGDIVTCRADGQPATRLVDLRPRRARFSYSEDGRTWRETWRDLPALTAAAQRPRERTVYVRLATDDGRVEVVERATSGRPDLHPVDAGPTSGMTP